MASRERIEGTGAGRRGASRRGSWRRRDAVGLLVLVVTALVGPPGLPIIAARQLSAQQRSMAGESTARGALRRRADWGARLAPAGGDSGVLVRRVDPASPAGRAGLRPGDRVLALNGAPVRTADEFWPVFQALRGGDAVVARVVRAPTGGGARAETLAVRFVLDSVTHERVPGATSEYGAIRSDRGYLLRTIVNRPERAGSARLPAVLFIPWLSCDPVETPDPGTDGYAHMLRDVASGSGLVLVRVEKPGTGDSEGPVCRQASLEDEMDAYRTALRAVRAMPGVDPDRIFLLGGSIGGGLAPVLAAESPEGIAGVIAVAGFTRTWYEHMLDIERRRLTLLGHSPAEVNEGMRGFARLYADYLLGGRTPGQVVAAHPELQSIWYDEPAHQYGRPASYFQGVAQLDVEGAWATLADRRIPALVVWGEFDWIMGRAEAERAAEVVNARRPGLVRLVVLPKTDHGLMVYATPAAAFADERPRYDGGAGRAVVEWLRERVGAGRADRGRAGVGAVGGDMGGDTAR